MISEAGYLPIGRALKEWREFFVPKFLAELLERRDGAESEEKGDYQVTEDNAFLEAARKTEAYSRAKKGADRLFFHALTQSHLSVFAHGRSMMIAPEILTLIEPYYFYEEFWSFDLNEFDNFSLRAETVEKWISLPEFDEIILLFVDPFTWSIDLRAYRVVCERVSQVINPLEYYNWKERSKSDADGDFATDDEPSTPFELLEKMIAKGENDDFPDYTLSDASNWQLEYFDEYHFPILTNVQLQSLETLEGASLCVSVEEWALEFEKLKSAGVSETQRFPVRGAVQSDNRGRPRIREFASVAYWEVYPDGHDATSDGWKMVAQRVSKHMQKRVSEDTIRRALGKKK